MVGVSIDVSSMRHAIRSGSPAHASFVWTGRELLLAFRAPERRAPVLGEALDDAAAAGGLALLALAIVDLKGMLEIAELAGGLAMVAQRRLQAGLLLGAGVRQHGGVEFVADRFGTETPEQRLLVERLASDDLH